MALDDPLILEDRSMRDSERSTGEELAVGDAAGEDLGAAAKRRPPRRWTAEEKARIVRESFRPGKQVGEVARRNGVEPRRLSEWRGRASGQAHRTVFAGICRARAEAVLCRA